jgi:hypothetical protein
MTPAIPSDASLGIPLQLIFFATLGAFVLYLLNRLQERRPFSLFSGLNIDVGIKAKPLIIFTDMLISSLLGGVLVIALSSPESIPQSLLGGLGLTGLLSPFSHDTRGPNP